MRIILCILFATTIVSACSLRGFGASDKENFWFVDENDGLHFCKANMTAEGAAPICYAAKRQIGQSPSDPASARLRPGRL